eukprot:jgi/Mesvir1/3384/Mv05087-RA.1
MLAESSVGTRITAIAGDIRAQGASSKGYLPVTCCEARQRETLPPHLSGGARLACSPGIGNGEVMLPRPVLACSCSGNVKAYQLAFDTMNSRITGFYNITVVRACSRYREDTPLRCPNLLSGITRLQLCNCLDAQTSELGSNRTLWEPLVVGINSNCIIGVDTCPPEQYQAILLDCANEGPQFLGLDTRYYNTLFRYRVMDAFLDNLTGLVNTDVLAGGDIVMSCINYEETDHGCPNTNAAKISQVDLCQCIMTIVNTWHSNLPYWAPKLKEASLACDAFQEVYCDDQERVQLFKTFCNASLHTDMQNKMDDIFIAAGRSKISPSPPPRAPSAPSPPSSINFPSASSRLACGRALPVLWALLAVLLAVLRWT